MKKKLNLSIYDEKRKGVTRLFVEIPFNKPIVWKEYKTPIGNRIGFKRYKKWWEFWK